MKCLREVWNFLFVLGLLLEWPFVMAAILWSERRERKFRVVGNGPK